MDEHAMKIDDEATSFPAKPWERICAALCHGGPVLWFLPYRFLIPVVIWLLASRRYPSIARNAREAVIYWTFAYMGLIVLASIIGWTWLQTIMWLALASWGCVAAWSGWAGIERPYPKALKDIALSWEKHEPEARARLAVTLKNIYDFLRNTKISQGATASPRQQSLTEPIEAPAVSENPGEADLSTGAHYVAPPARPVLQTEITVPHWVTYGLLGGVAGVLLGAPLSYWFQPGMLRSFISFPNYLSAIMDSLGHLNEVSQGGDQFGIAATVVQTMVVSGIAGAVLGAVLGVKKDSDIRRQG